MGRAFGKQTVMANGMPEGRAGARLLSGFMACGLPLGVLTAVPGVSGSGKSSLVSQALVELMGDTWVKGY